MKNQKSNNELFTENMVFSFMLDEALDKLYDVMYDEERTTDKRETYKDNAWKVLEKSAKREIVRILKGE